MVIPKNLVIGPLSVLALTPASQTASLSTIIDAKRESAGGVAGVTVRFAILVCIIR